MAEQIIVDIVINDADIQKLSAELRKIAGNMEQNIGAYRKFDNELGKTSAAIGVLGKRIAEATDPDEIRELAIEFQKLSASIQRMPTPSLGAGIDRAAMQTRALSKEVDALGNHAAVSANGATGAFGGLTSVIKGAGAAALAFVSIDMIGQLGRKIIDITKQFEVYRSVLTNTLGSQAKADASLRLIEKTAATTNFSVKDLTDTYVKLVNSGFRPTEKEIIKLTDVANSAGKGIDQLTEAVIDAQTFEFERLKEFGIRASKEGEKITFTFREKKTVVDATAASVRKYVLGLGDLQGVQGSTAAISATLAGQISNLEDSFDFFLKTIGQSLTPAFKGAISGMKSLIDVSAQLLSSNTDVATSTDNLIRSIKGLEQTEVKVEPPIDNAILVGISSFFSGFSDGVAKAWKSLQAVFTQLGLAFDSLSNAFSKLFATESKFSGFASKVGDAISVAIIVPFSGMITIFTSVVIAITEVIGAIVNLANAIVGIGDIVNGTRTFGDVFGQFADQVSAGAQRVGLALKNAKIGAEDLTDVSFSTQTYIKDLKSAEIGTKEYTKALVNLEGQLKRYEAILAVANEANNEELRQNAENNIKAIRAVFIAEEQRAKDTRLLNEKATAAAKELTKEQIKAAEDALKQLRKLQMDNDEASIKDAEKAAWKKLINKRDADLREVKATQYAAQIKAEIQRRYELEVLKLTEQYAVKRREAMLKNQLEESKLLAEQDLRDAQAAFDEGIINERELAKIKRNIAEEQAQRDAVRLNQAYLEEKKRIDDLLAYADKENKDYRDVVSEDEKKALEERRKAAEEAQKKANDTTRTNIRENTKAEIDGIKSVLAARRATGSVETQIDSERKLGKIRVEEARKLGKTREEIGLIEAETEFNAAKLRIENLEKQRDAVQETIEILSKDPASLIDNTKLKEALATAQSLDNQILETAENSKKIVLDIGVESGADVTSFLDLLGVKTKEITDQQKKRIEETMQLLKDLTKEFVNSTLTAFTTLLEAQDAAEIASIERQQEANDRLAESQEKRIEDAKSAIDGLTGEQKKAAQRQLAIEESRLAQTLAANEELDRRKEEIEKRAAQRNKAIAVAQAVINGALAATNILASPAVQATSGAIIPILLGLIALTTAAQVATIIAQPLAKGTVSVSGGIEGRDSVPAMLMPGEAVIPTKSARKNRAIIRALVNGEELPQRVLNFRDNAPTIAYNNMNGADVRRELQAIAAEIRGKEVANVSLNADSAGFSAFVARQNRLEKYRKGKFMGKV